MQTIEIATHLNALPDRVWDELNKPRLLFFVAHPVLKFKAVYPEILPEQWKEGDYVMKLSWHGIVPLGKQVISISRPAREEEKRLLRDKGHGTFVKRWDHLVSVEADGDGTRYTDRIEVDAGIFTLIVAAFARRFYAHRQSRWRRLVESDFDYEEF